MGENVKMLSEVVVVGYGTQEGEPDRFGCYGKFGKGITFPSFGQCFAGVERYDSRFAGDAKLRDSI